MPGKAVLAAAGALALAASPAVAQDAGAARASVPAESVNEMGGDSSTALIIGIVALALAIFLAFDSGGAPDSP